MSLVSPTISHVVAIASLSLPYIPSSTSSTASVIPESSPSLQTNDHGDSTSFSGKATNTWIALAILFLVLCIVSTASVTVTRFTGMNLFTWISHTNRRGRRGRGDGGDEVADQDLVEEVFGPIVYRSGRKVRVVRKPKLWDLRVLGSKKEIGAVESWKSIMPIAARLKRPVVLLPAEPLPNIIVGSPSTSTPSPSNRHSRSSPPSPSSAFHLSPSSFSPLPPIPSSSLPSSSNPSSPKPPSSPPKPRNEIQLTVAIAMPINPDSKQNTNASTQSSIPDFALGTVLMPTRCKFKDASSSATSSSPNPQQTKTRSSSRHNILEDLERAARNPSFGLFHATGTSSRSSSPRVYSASHQRAGGEDVDLTRRILAAA